MQGDNQFIITPKQYQLINNILQNTKHQDLIQRHCYDCEYLIYRKENANYSNIVIDEDGDTMISVFFTKDKEKSFRLFMDYEDFDLLRVERALDFKK